MLLLHVVCLLVLSLSLCFLVGKGEWMQLDTSKIRHLRQHKAWTQQQLADICGLSLRTIQRVELHGSASLETGRSLAAAFDTEYTALFGQC